ncbi:hypothetical protein DFA_03536 [Cavenderia fasciculata]|uniref:Uncharacterized protein n=1 Tax=Cavenderia fasciculata TaxID=261658 RepID=F4PHV3_CACFS|nr:uncharacterized protein DFA_03536 [Cavenderia fasciculata]EGG25287.1 hypothetical protein DFA_03536 [Cavenderia fasciculata]|eukprot:XP_004363138.1 hypothetical protein DFA_03536 [Cavenderia fasciculata]
MLNEIKVMEMPAFKGSYFFLINLAPPFFLPNNDRCCQKGAVCCRLDPISIKGLYFCSLYHIYLQKVEHQLTRLVQQHYYNHHHHHHRISASASGTTSTLFIISNIYPHLHHPHSPPHICASIYTSHNTRIVKFTQRNSSYIIESYNHSSLLILLIYL